MHVGLRIDPRRACAWHRRLIERLQAAGHHVVLLPALDGPSSPWPQRLLRFEARLRGLSDHGLLAPRTFAELAAASGSHQETDVVVDLEGDGAEHGSVPTWHLATHRGGGTGPLLNAILCGETPVVSVKQGPVPIVAGRPGSEALDLLQERVSDILGGCITLILAALDGGGAVLPATDESYGRNLGPVRAAGLAIDILARRIGRRMYRQVFRTPHWRVGWRRIGDADLFDLRHQPDQGWHDLPDDGRHFYADPFPILHEGRVTLFVEDYVHATGRGCIAAVAFGPDGPLGTPEPVLERPYHLSYPFVFARDGAVWMIPETGEAGTIELYRATRFPGGWVREAILVSGLVAGDATLHQAPDGRWWMFATVKDDGAASDALHLWSAPDFRGPWTAHPHNPVLVDIASARPAGRMVMRDGALLRPVQDCRAGYGAALGIARVTRLDLGGFAQEIETVVGPGPRWPGHCLHTLNSAGGFEFIDGSGQARRPWGEILRS